MNFLERQPFFVIFGIVALGMWLGRKKIGGIALGSVVCIILIGLITSIWAFKAAGVSLANLDAAAYEAIGRDLKAMAQQAVEDWRRAQAKA